MDATSIIKELEWLGNTLGQSKENQKDEISQDATLKHLPPDLSSAKDLYGKFIAKKRFSTEERMVLALALAPYISPNLLDFFDGKSTIYGGIRGKNHKGFIPTGETALFILGGNSQSKRINYLHFFDKTHNFYKDNLITIGNTDSHEPYLSGVLIPSKDLINLALRNIESKPDFDADFPAKLLTTEMEWEALILPKNTKEGLNEIKAWIKHGDTLMHKWGMSKKLKKGYRSLFYGPPGTGKTLTATLLGKHTNKDVYRIDLSMVVSKYIGETEKNLSKIFDRAEHKDWILFFDEADALFGKRTSVNDSHDRYANQEISFLLQRIEDYDGLVILASNMKNNIDEAFTRRFQSIIHFPMPKTAEKIALWENAFSKVSSLDDRVKIEDLAAKFELSGGAIMNVSRYSSLMALSRESTVISLADIEEGIKKELEKEGRII